MKKYSVYKESGVEWIGKIPDSWTLARIKYVSRVYNGNSLNDELKVEFSSINEDDIPYIGSKDIDRDSNRINYNNGLRIPREKDGFKKALKGSFLLCIEGGSAGKKIGYIEQDVCFVNKLACFNYPNKFLFYYAQSFPFIKMFNSSMTGMIGGVSIKQLGGFFLPIPSEPEQTQIAKYLDHKTAIIDALIEKKELLIKKLTEQRQAIINEAVTKGLNPNAKMKDSGIEWLGEIPEHWGFMKMKFGCEFILDGTHGSFKRVSEGYRLLSVRNIVNDKFIFREDDSLVSEKDYLDISTKFKIQEGDIQLAIVGATLGKVALVTDLSEDYVTQRSLATFRINKQIFFNEFFYYFLRSESFQSYLWLNAAFSAQPGVYLGTLQNCSIPLPEMKDQLQIVNQIKEGISVIEILMNKVLLQIKKLKKYRQSIISEAVTGKIDVREWQAQTTEKG